MGIFEMMDLAGLDVSWRQRVELGLTDKEKRDPSKRYLSLADKICEKGYFGQKTSRGWYYYDPKEPRVPLPCSEIDTIIEQHRKQEVK